MSMSAGHLEPTTLALQALAWLASDEDRLVRFLNLTGITPQALRKSLTDPISLGAVLDYLLAWEPLLIDFTNENALSPESVIVARHKLPGGAPLM
jgi:hypothetical protein